MTDTIFALSSGRPPAAIAIVRISGPAAGDVLRRLAGTLPPPRQASLRTLRDPADGILLDRAMVLWLPGPATATGEDLVELHLHGGRAVIAAISGALARFPRLRPAEAGEFTRRALLTGRIDLTEAEGLRDLLAAESEAHRRAALVSAGGAVGRRIEGWRHALVLLSARIEAVLDFADEDDVSFDQAGWTADAAALLAELTASLARPPAERLRDGVRVVIAGPPNAGKSTLFNALVERDAAIVSPQAGTTRDVLEAAVTIAGTPFLIHDTAGLRDAGDAIEAIGIGRARDAMADADILLWLGEGAPPPAPGVPIAVAAQADRRKDEAYPDGTIALSVRDGWGIEALVARMIAIAAELLPREDEASFNRRQRDLVGEARSALMHAIDAPSLVLVAEDLRDARVAFDRITGRAGVEDMLDAVFAGFCIGK